jgi:amino acid transporter
MHRALRAQEDPALQLKHAFRVRWYPFVPLFLFVTTLFTLACTIYTSASPIDGPSAADTFFETMLCMPLLITAFISWKLWFRTKIQDPKTADLKSGRRYLTEEELEKLDSYYAMPSWKRLRSYVTF